MGEETVVVKQVAQAFRPALTPPDFEGFSP
jgi:hypothetical protein